MGTCSLCGDSFDEATAEQEFMDRLKYETSVGLDFYNHGIYIYDHDLCPNCNFDKINEIMEDYVVCGCGKIQRIEDAREEFGEYLTNLGYTSGLFDAAMYEFDIYECGECNIRRFENHREEWEDENVGPFDND